MLPRLLATALLTLVLAACGGPVGSSQASSGTSDPVVAASPSTELVADVDIGGRTMHLVCVGPTDVGGPTILLEAGGGLDYSAWSQVIAGMQTTHRLCAYDRAGLGASLPADGSRTAVDQAADLQALLDAAGIPGPFVIGAHSFGAIVATLFAEANPDDVAGLVFVDPQAPRTSQGWLAALPPATADEPRPVAVIREDLESFETDPSMNPEHVHVRNSAAAATEALDLPGPLFGDRPVIVLSAQRAPEHWADLPPDLATTFTEIWRAGQQELADESTSGSFVEVPDVGHNIQGDDPAAVIDALERVVTAAT